VIHLSLLPLQAVRRAREKKKKKKSGEKRRGGKKKIESGRYASFGQNRLQRRKGERGRGRGERECGSRWFGLARGSILLRREEEKRERSRGRKRREGAAAALSLVMRERRLLPPTCPGRPNPKTNTKGEGRRPKEKRRERKRRRHDAKAVLRFYNSSPRAAKGKGREGGKNTKVSPPAERKEKRKKEKGRTFATDNFQAGGADRRGKENEKEGKKRASRPSTFCATRRGSSASSFHQYEKGGQRRRGQGAIKGRRGRGGLGEKGRERGKEKKKRKRLALSSALEGGSRKKEGIGQEREEEKGGESISAADWRRWGAAVAMFAQTGKGKKGKAEQKGGKE